MNTGPYRLAGRLEGFKALAVLILQSVTDHCETLLKWSVNCVNIGLFSSLCSLAQYSISHTCIHSRRPMYYLTMYHMQQSVKAEDIVNWKKKLHSYSCNIKHGRTKQTCLSNNTLTIISSNIYKIVLHQLSERARCQEWSSVWLCFQH